MRHAVVKKTNRAMQLGTKTISSATSQVNKQQTPLLSHFNLGQGGIATSTFLNRQKTAIYSNQIYGDEILDSAFLSNLADKGGIDPHDETAVGSLVCQILPQLSVDPRSIGGTSLKEDDKNGPTSNNLLLQGNGASSTTSKKPIRLANNGASKKLMNECLFSIQVGKFQIEGSTKHNFAKKKAKNKLRYICIVRSTNRPLLWTEEDQNELANAGGDQDDNADEGTADEDEEDGYDTMYTEYNMPSKTNKITEASSPEKKSTTSRFQNRNKFVPAATDEEEISSFPYLLCLALHSDGTSPDIRKVIPLSQLVAITITKEPNQPSSFNYNSSSSSGNQGNIRLRFRSGDIIEINTALRPSGDGPSSANDSNSHNRPFSSSSAKEEMRKERLLWSLLQIQSILCASVVERHVTKFRKSQSLLLPPLSAPHIDRAELQYLSTVNGFLSDSPTLVALLERQRMRGAGTRRIMEQDGEHGENTADDPNGAMNDGRNMNGNQGDNANAGDNMDGMAYDMMMGNYARLHLFQNPEEEKDAADILNASAWQPEESIDQKGKERKKKKKKESNSAINQDFDASATADALTLLLEKRMSDLEAETCRRLIAWEDEKSNLGNKMAILTENKNQSVDVLSLASLFSTLDTLDSELQSMELWLDERAAIIKPLTDDCREIEEENRQLEQHCRSYEILGAEMERLLNGLQLPDHLNQVLEDPGAVLPFVQMLSTSENNEQKESLAVETNEEGVDMIYEAGIKLKEVLDRAHTDGGIHLRAISEQIEILNVKKKTFCEGLSMIAVRVMETLAAEVVERLGPLNKETDTHTIMVKKLKDVSCLCRFQHFCLYL